jgi:NDP-sugar pyrophosphorylase family protein
MVGWKNIKTGEEKFSPPEYKEGSGERLMAYSCVVVFEHDIFRLMEEKGFTGKFSLIDLYLELAKDHPIYGYDHSGDRFVDVGKPESIAEAESLFP